MTFPLSVTGDEIDKSLIKVSWTSNGSDIASFSEAETQIKDGFRWDTRDFVNGDFSLTIPRASSDLQGLYECRVSYNSTTLHSSTVTINNFGTSWLLRFELGFMCTFKPKSTTKLNSLNFFCFSPFLASPTLSVSQQWVVLETESQLKCRADRFYPPPVFFSWTRDGKVIQSPYQVEGEQSTDGYYMAEGNLTIYPSREDQNVTFGCKVSHNGSSQEQDFQLNITRKLHKNTSNKTSMTHHIFPSCTT